MDCVKVEGGWRIRMKEGRWFPKLYKAKALCQIRVDQMLRHTPKKK